MLLHVFQKVQANLVKKHMSKKVREGGGSGRGGVALSQWLWHFRPIVPTSGTSLLEAQVQAPQMRQVNAPVTPTEVGGGKYFWGS